MYDNKIVENIITVNIVAYEDPETAPEGEPESIEKEITLTKTWDADWGATEPFDVKEDLRQAFKMTTYQIFSALKSGEMKLWVGEVGATRPTRRLASRPIPARLRAGGSTARVLPSAMARRRWPTYSSMPQRRLCTSTAAIILRTARLRGRPSRRSTSSSRTVVTATYNITFDITAPR